MKTLCKRPNSVYLSELPRSPCPPSGVGKMSQCKDIASLPLRCWVQSTRMACGPTYASSQIYRFVNLTRGRSMVSTNFRIHTSLFQLEQVPVEQALALALELAMVHSCKYYNLCPKSLWLFYPCKVCAQGSRRDLAHNHCCLSSSFHSIASQELALV